MKSYILFFCLWTLTSQVLPQNISNRLYLYSIDNQTFEGYYLLRFQDEDSTNILVLSENKEVVDKQNPKDYSSLKVGEFYKFTLTKFDSLSHLQYKEYFPDYRGIRPVKVYIGNPERGDEILLLSYDTAIVEFHTQFYQSDDILGLSIKNTTIKGQDNR